VHLPLNVLTLAVTILYTAVPVAAGVEAVITVGPNQQTGYPVCFGGSDSRGINPWGAADRFGIEWFTWDFGDSSTVISGEYLNTVRHTYSAPGEYTTTLIVRDAQRATSTATAHLTVEDLPRVTVQGTDVQALRDAIVSLNGEAGIVHMPEGEYHFPYSVDIPSNTILEGAGSAKTIIICEKDEYVIRAMDRFIDGNNLVPARNVRITGLALLGSQKQSRFGLETIAGGKNLYVDHCELGNMMIAAEERDRICPEMKIFFPWRSVRLMRHRIRRFPGRCIRRHPAFDKNFQAPQYSASCEIHNARTSS
jgi:hypothetical protein